MYKIEKKFYFIMWGDSHGSVEIVVALLVSLLQAKQFLDVRQRLGDLLGKPVRILRIAKKSARARKKKSNDNNIKKYTSKIHNYNFECNNKKNISSWWRNKKQHGEFKWEWRSWLFFYVVSFESCSQQLVVFKCLRYKKKLVSPCLARIVLTKCGRKSSFHRL